MHYKYLTFFTLQGFYHRPDIIKTSDPTQLPAKCPRSLGGGGGGGGERKGGEKEVGRGRKKEKGGREKEKE